jgi:hypothetical protein
VRRLLAVALAGLCAAGCGSQASDYRGKVNDVRKRYEPRFDKITRHIQSDVSSHDLAGLGADARRGAVLMAAYANDVARIAPPERLKPQAEQLVGAYREWAQALRQLATAARTHQATTVRSALSAFNDASRKEHAAVAALNAAG